MRRMERISTTDVITASIRALENACERARAMNLVKVNMCGSEEVLNFRAASPIQWEWFHKPLAAITCPSHTLAALQYHGKVCTCKWLSLCV